MARSQGAAWPPRVDAVPAPRHPQVVTSTAPILAPELARAVAAQRDRLDLDLVSRAYRVSAQAHRGQKRESGDDYVSHSVAGAASLPPHVMDSPPHPAPLLPYVGGGPPTPPPGIPPGLPAPG